MLENNSGQGKFHLISLGCARNRSDSEVMLGAMKKEGWEFSENPEDSDTLVINTCGFIEDAKDESIGKILEAAEIKKAKPATKIVVAGCLAQRYKNQLKEGLPEVDLFVGTDEFPSLPKFLNDNLPQGTVKAKRQNYLFSGELPKQNTLSSSSAYVKVAEGCQHSCSFCIIPAIRGPLRSRPIENIVKEVSRLGDEGVKEINLIAQDLAAYGRDSGEFSLKELLAELVKVESVQWIRMLYVYPENICDDFLELWASQEKIVPYIDIPVQHASDSILKKMNRDVNRIQLSTTIEKVRKFIPGVAIRTSIMVGFPGETEADFEELCTFVREMRFEHLGCFTYSKEEGTVAGRMKDQVPKEIMIERQRILMEIQKEVSRESLASLVGTVQPVIVQGTSEESELLFEGRLVTQAPEVDGVVYLNDGAVRPGEIQMVKISDSHEYDLVGEVVSPRTLQ